MKYKTNLDVKNVIVTVHGIKSKGKNLEKLSLYMSKDKFFVDSHFSNINYGKLLAVVNYIPIVRSLTMELVASRLATITYKYPNAKIVVICHSNGTWAISKALEKYYPKFKIDQLILLGCVIKRKFDWKKYININVFNFIGVKDKVLLLAKPFYGMGWSGRYGFKTHSKNLKQFRFNWGHTGFVREMDTIKSVVKSFLR
jgi:hypothetical protein